MAAPVPTVAQLLARYPEFDGAAVDHPDLLTTALEESAAETSDWAFPSEQAQLNFTLLQAALALYQSPKSRMLGLDDTAKPKADGLRKELYRKAQVATMGLRVF